MKKLFLVLFMATLNVAPLLARENPPANSARYSPAGGRETIVIERRRRHHRHHRRHRHHHHHHHRIVEVRHTFPL